MQDHPNPAAGNACEKEMILEFACAPKEGALVAYRSEGYAPDGKLMKKPCVLVFNTIEQEQTLCNALLLALEALGGDVPCLDDEIRLTCGRTIPQWELMARSKVIQRQNRRKWWGVRIPAVILTAPLWVPILLCGLIFNAVVGPWVLLQEYRRKKKVNSMGNQLST
jgi:hypothetical protein